MSLLTARPRDLLPPAGPERLLVIGAFVASIGFGLYTSGAAIYFVESVGLSATQVGLGVSIAGLAGLPIGIPLGRLADRVGPREVTLALTAVQVVMLVAATAVRSFPAFVVVVSILTIAVSGADVTRGALVSGLIGKQRRVRSMAYQRSAFNIGFSLGVLAAGVAVGINTRPAYLALILGNATTAVLACVLTLMLPRLPGVGRAAATRLTTALRDVAYLVVSVTSGVTRIGDLVLTIGLPLWVVGSTHAPRPVAAWLIAVNTALVVMFQVRASRTVNGPGGSVRALRLSILALAAGCAVTAVTSSLTAVAAVAVIVVIVVLLTAGELWGESARWALRFDLAPADAQGAYGGIFTLGAGLPVVAGPLLVTGLPARFGPAGWLLVALVFLLAFPLVAPTVAWAQRKRPVQMSVDRASGG
jgi:hypothetical protein